MGAPGDLAAEVAADRDAPWRDGDFLIERIDRDEHRFHVREIVFAGRTAFQEVVLADTTHHGLLLMIDGDPQSAQVDEFVYHEALVHPAMLLHPNPRRVLILGGGEGATLREVLRHRSVEKATMVDIDGAMIALARRHLGAWHQGAFDDPRTELRIADALEFLAACETTYDIIIADVCDYAEGTSAAALYSRGFLGALRAALGANGVLAIQAGDLGTAKPNGTHRRLRRLAAGSFGPGPSYSTYVGSFWTEWGFLLLGAVTGDPGTVAPARVDGLIEARGLGGNLRFYDGRSHTRMFNLPRPIRDAIEADGWHPERSRYPVRRGDDA